VLFTALYKLTILHYITYAALTVTVADDVATWNAVDLVRFLPEQFDVVRAVLTDSG